MAVDSTVANTGLFLPFLSFFAWTDEDYTYLFPTDTTWCLLPAHGATAVVPPVPMPNQCRHRDTNQPVWTGILIGAGHPGGGMRGV